MSKKIVWVAQQYKRTGYLSLFLNIYEFKNGKVIIKDPTIRSIVKRHQSQYKNCFSQLQWTCIHQLAILKTFVFIKDDKRNKPITMDLIILYLNFYLSKLTEKYIEGDQKQQ